MSRNLPCNTIDISCSGKSCYIGVGTNKKANYVPKIIKIHYFFKITGLLNNNPT